MLDPIEPAPAPRTGEVLVQVKSLLEPACPSDGYRLMISRRTPPIGVFDGWEPRFAPSLKLLEAAISNGRRAYFWDEFRRIFLGEMDTEDGRAAVHLWARRVYGGERLTLLCFCAENQLCHRPVIMDLIMGHVGFLQLVHGRPVGGGHA